MLHRREQANLPVPARIPEAVPFIDSDDAPLLMLDGKQGRDEWLLRHAYEGVHIFGGTGSGKTSGSGRALALTYLRLGMGGIVLCAKPGEYELWRDYARRAGREHQLIRFHPDGPYRFNFLDYQATVSSDAQGRLDTGNIVHLLMQTAEAAERSDALKGQGGNEPAFWRRAPREMLSHTIDAVWSAWGRLRLSEIMECILTAPADPADFLDDAKIESSFCLKTLRQVIGAPAWRLPAHDQRVVLNYFRDNLARLDNRTRSNLVTTLTSQLAPLLKGRMHELFGTSTTLVPELTHEGAIIVLDFPEKVHKEAGLLAQHIFKYQWQVATERRDIRTSPRPVFCWADEAQFFITPYDIHFQTTARSARACTVYLTQTVSNYFATIGGSNPRDATMAFLANFVTQIFHRNADRNTNEMAAEMIGRNLQLRRSESRGWSDSRGGSEGTSSGWNTGTSISSSGGHYSTSSNAGSSAGTNRGISWSSGYSMNQTVSEQMELDIQPAEFGTIRSGGPQNGLRVDGLLYQSGRRFEGNRGRNYITLSFDQAGG